MYFARKMCLEFRNAFWRRFICQLFLITLFFRIIILDHEHWLKSLWRVSGVHTILLFAHWVINNYEFNISFLIEKKKEKNIRTHSPNHLIKPFPLVAVLHLRLFTSETASPIAKHNVVLIPKTASLNRFHNVFPRKQCIQWKLISRDDHAQMPKMFLTRHVDNVK